MTFFTHFVRPERKLFVRSLKSNVSGDGYLKPARRIELLMKAGARLTDYRNLAYSNGEYVGIPPNLTDIPAVDAEAYVLSAASAYRQAQAETASRPEFSTSSPASPGSASATIEPKAVPGFSAGEPVGNSIPAASQSEPVPTK